MEPQALVSGFGSSLRISTTMSTQTNKPLSSSLFPQNPHKFVSFKVSTRQNLNGSSKMVVLRFANSAERGTDAVPDMKDCTNSKLRRKKLAVFVSGGGSNFKAIHQACVQGSVNGEVVVLVTNKSSCGGAEYARNSEISVISFPRTKDEPDGLSTADLVATLRRFGVDFVLLAGYLKLIPVELIQAYPRSILNIHPSLLPAFGGKGYYGMKVHKAVISSGARFSGATVHFVDEHYDTGCILAQRVVPVFANDNVEELAARVLHEEHQLYVEVTNAVCEERVIWRQDGVPLIQSREDPNQFY